MLYSDINIGPSDSIGAISVSVMLLGEFIALMSIKVKFHKVYGRVVS